MRKFLRYFNTHKLIEGLAVAILGSLFIYLALFEYRFTILNTILAIIFLSAILQQSSKGWFWSGFFIGVFWFWWMGVSFYYYGYTFAIPIVIFLVGAVYGLEFFLVSKVIEIISFRLFKLYQKEIQIILKAIFLFIASYIHPFGFNWFKVELIFVNSFLGVDKFSFGATLVGVVLALILRGKLKYISVVFFILAISFDSYKVSYSDKDKIELITTKIDVRDKWSIKKIPFQVRDVLFFIDRAIAKGKKAIILPESVLPFFLNSSKEMLKELKRRSFDIDIVLGALYQDKNQNRNSLYFFHKGKFIVSNKVVLVPFGESNPLPKWASRWVNRIFFDGAPDYTPAKKPTDFFIGNKKFRGAICYEGTSDKIYKNSPKNLIVISNNGWFYPSIEPILQKLLFIYYVRVYKVSIYHSSNMSSSFKIFPKKFNFF